MRARSSVTAATISLLFSGTACFSKPEVYPLTDPSNDGKWILNKAVSDEFDGHRLDEKKWLIQGKDGTFRSNFRGRPPWQFSPDNVRVEKGRLKIQTRHEPDYEWVDPGTNEFRFTTGGISTKATFFKGYMEIKSKSANASTTSSFWTTGEKGVRSELDVFESIGRPSEAKRRTNLMWSTIHDWTQPLPNKVWTETNPIPFNFVDGFHVFGAEWNETSVKFYADGKLIHTATRAWVEEHGIDSKRWPLTGGQHVWVDSEIFPWWGEPDPNNLPADFEIEYVRVWQQQ